MNQKNFETDLKIKIIEISKRLTLVRKIYY